MKILVVGDMHFRLELPYGTHFEDGRRGEWEEVKKTIVDAAASCDAVVLLGDVLDKRHNHSSVLAELVAFLKELGDKDVHIISGNHEKYEGEKTALDFLKDVNPAWHVYTKPTAVRVGPPEKPVALYMLPYMTIAELGVTSFAEGLEQIHFGMDIYSWHHDVLFHHHAVSGHQTLGGLTDLFNEIVLDKNALQDRFKFVIGGHVHEPQGDANVHVAGSLFTQSVGEHDKRVLVLDTDTMLVEEIPLPVRPIHAVAYTKESDVAHLPDRAIVKATLKDPSIGVESARAALERFDAHILIEDYPNERVKAHVVDSNDLSVESLLSSYAKQRGLNESELIEAFGLIRE